MPGKMARSGPQRQLDGLEYRELAGPSVLCLPAIQKIPNFHVSSGFIWGIPVNLIIANTPCRCLTSSFLPDRLTQINVEEANKGHPWSVESK